MPPIPPPMAWPNNNLEVAYRITSGIWTTAGICAPCGRPPGDVYHDSTGGTRNEATDAPSRAPASMRMSAVFTIQISITRRGVFTAQSRGLVENAECDEQRASATTPRDWRPFLAFAGKTPPPLAPLSRLCGHFPSACRWHPAVQVPARRTMPSNTVSRLTHNAAFATSVSHRSVGYIQLLCLSV